MARGVLWVLEDNFSYRRKQRKGRKSGELGIEQFQVRKEKKVCSFNLSLQWLMAAAAATTTATTGGC